MVPRLMRALYTKHISAPREYRRGDGISRLPIQQVSMKITNACNLRCKTCGQWGDTGYNFGKSAEELRKVVPVENYLEMVDRLSKHRPVYYIWGGEPFLYPGLLDLTARIKAQRSLLSVVTNATFLEKHAEAVVQQKWDGLMFSLDGPEAVHDEIRGKKGTFAKVAAGIRAVKAFKKQYGAATPWILPLVTISVWNADTLDEIVDVAAELGADCCIIYLSWFTNETIGAAHTRIFEEKLGVTPTAWKGYLFDHDVDVEALKASRTRIEAARHKFPILYVPDLPDDQLAEYYANPGHFFGYGPCISPWTTIELMPNGDAAPCRDYPDYVLGNVLETPIEEIWNGERYVTFRKTLKEHGGTFPICARCCGLMGW